MPNYYHLPTSTEREPRGAERRTDTGEWLSPPDYAWSVEQAALCGFVPIASTPQPADTDTTTYERSVELVDKVPTVTWTPRAKTPAELAAATTTTNTATLEAKARAAIIANGTYLALAAPTNAQTLAQVRALTRQMTALVRLSLRGGLLDDTTGT